MNDSAGSEKGYSSARALMLGYDLVDCLEALIFAGGGMIRVVEHAVNWLAKCSTIASIIMVGLITLSVLMRYIVGMPLTFSDELVGLLFVAIAFTVFPACELRCQNIAVTVVVDMFPSRLRVFCQLAGQCLVIVFTVVLGHLAFKFAMTSAKFDATMESLDWPLAPWMMIVPASMALIGIVVIVRIFCGISNRGELEKDDS
jgi:TRAP-type C4-dicarboxylate transport system permease small subunit